MVTIGAWVVAGMGLFAEPTVRPLAAGVVWEEVKEAFDGFPSLNQQDPVKLAVLVDLGGLGVIELSEDKSKIESLTDGAGNELKGKIWAFPSISKDGKLMRLDLLGEKAPAAGSKTLTAKGSLVVISGSKTAVEKSKLVPAEKDAVLEVSKNLRFKISKAGKPDWGDDPFAVDLEIKRDIPEVAEVAFYDEKGALIESSEGGSSRMGFGKMVTVQRTYNLKRKVKSFRAEVKVWIDLEEVTVPFDFTVGIGGAK